MKSINVLMKPSSSLCNMNCDYCFYCDEASKRIHSSYGFMTEETLENIIRKTLRKASHTVNFYYQGGEPTLAGINFFTKAMEHQKKYQKDGVQVTNSIQTNGLHISDEFCRFFHDNHFLVGVSIDGTAAIHNSLRHTKSGEETYNKIVNSIDKLNQNHVDYNILTVVTPLVATNIKEIYHAYKSHGWMYQQYIACLDPLNEGHCFSSHSLTPELYGNFLVVLFDLWYRDWKKGKMPYIRQFENYIMLAAGMHAESCDQNGNCGIQYVVEADGSVYPCDFYMLDDYCLGNFNTNQYRDFDKKRTEIRFLERSLLLDPSCFKCPFYALCRGGCQRNRDLFPGKNYYSNYFCKSYKMLFEAHEKHMKEMAESINHR